MKFSKYWSTNLYYERVPHILSPTYENCTYNDHKCHKILL